MFTRCTTNPAVQPKPITRYSKLDSLFRTITKDTLYVYSDGGSPDKNYTFAGRNLDSEQVSLLPFLVKYNYNWNKDYGASYKFHLDSAKVAMLIRSPGEYTSSKIQLMIFDSKADSVIKTFAIADYWGDAGEGYIYNTCIFKDAEKNTLLLTYFYYSYDHSVNDSNDTIIEVNKSYMLINLSKNLGDTLTTDSTEITKKFPLLLKKLEAK